MSDDRIILENKNSTVIRLEDDSQFPYSYSKDRIARATIGWDGEEPEVSVLVDDIQLMSLRRLKLLRDWLNRVIHTIEQGVSP